MPNDLVIALAQLNPTVGDLERNVAAVLDARRRAAEAGADLLVTTELVITGYPPEDLILRRSFVEAAQAAGQRVAEQTGDGGPAILLGCPWIEDGKLYNAVLLCANGEIVSRRYKHELPNYGVFDEVRLFTPGPAPGPMMFRGARLGVMICEDMWGDAVSETLAESGAEIMIVLNGSPFEVNKEDTRLNLAVARVTETGLPLVYVNQVGGQDELVFDGASFVLGADCRLKARAPSWREAMILTRWSPSADGEGWACAETEIVAPPERLESIYQAMVLGLRDYVGKIGFPGVLIGLSGGIDSALSAAVAVDALGADRVHCVRLPSRYSSQGSLDDAQALADLLGVRCDTVPIDPAVTAFEGMLAALFAGQAANEAEENIQARARGIVLMALSNKFGKMVLTTGNKSEMAVGYATLYGDMSGGFSVLKDVYKTTVFALANWRNENRPEGAMGPEGRAIPENTITKPPSAELRPDQTDQDSLPPYDQLDDILHCLIEEELGIRTIVDRGHHPDLVVRVRNMLYAAEYKRRQAPPGVKITDRAFGRDRRYPIVNRFRDRV